jgi:hypothetical protein
VAHSPRALSTDPCASHAAAGKSTTRERAPPSGSCGGPPSTTPSRRRRPRPPWSLGRTAATRPSGSAGSYHPAASSSRSRSIRSTQPLRPRCGGRPSLRHASPPRSYECGAAARPAGGRARGAGRQRQDRDRRPCGEVRPHRGQVQLGPPGMLGGAVLVVVPQLTALAPPGAGSCGSWLRWPAGASLWPSRARWRAGCRAASRGAKGVVVRLRG